MKREQVIQRFDMGVSKNSGTQNGWFIMENPIKIDDLGVPEFLETSICLDGFVWICEISLDLDSNLL